MIDLWVDAERDGLTRADCIVGIHLNYDNTLKVSTVSTVGGGSGERWDLDPNEYTVCRAKNLNNEEHHARLDRHLAKLLTYARAHGISGISEVRDSKLVITPLPTGVNSAADDASADSVAPPQPR